MNREKVDEVAVEILNNVYNSNVKIDSFREDLYLNKSFFQKIARWHIKKVEEVLSEVLSREYEDK